MKIRLSQERIDSVLGVTKVQLNWEDIFADVEIWANLPNAAAAVSAMAASLISRSWLITVLATVAGFIVANLTQTVVYSRFLKIFIAQLLGAWMLAIPCAIGTSLYLYFHSAFLVGLVQLAIVLAAMSGITDVLLFPITPLRLFVRRLFRVPMGDVELAFVRIIDQHTRRWA